MYDKKIIKILNKIYSYSNNYNYDHNNKTYTFHIPEKLSENEKMLLNQSGLEFNKIEYFEHDSTIKKLKMLSQLPEMEDKVNALFIKAIGQGFHRGLQPIISYAFAKNVPEHDFTPIEKGERELLEATWPCKVCGLPRSSWENSSCNLFHFYIGYCRLGAYHEILTDLEEIQHFSKENIQPEDLSVFKQLIEIIQLAEPKETPSELINRISKAKILQGSNLTTRAWLIRILAELGILKNELAPEYSVYFNFLGHDEFLKLEKIVYAQAPNHRSEVSFPISLWRGGSGINIARLHQFLEKFEQLIEPST